MMLPNNPQFFIDENHPANEMILRVLRMDLGETSSKLIEYYDDCLLYIGRIKSNGKGTFKTYPVFVEGNSGVIIAAVLGTHAVAIRYANPSFRKDALTAGAAANFNYKGNAVDLGSDWVFLGAELDIKKVRHALANTMDTYEHSVRQRHAEQELKEAVARGNESLIKADFPSNIALIEFLRSRRPDAPASAAAPTGFGTWNLGIHPDILDYLWKSLPAKAAISTSTRSWLVYGTPILVNSQTGIIFAYATGTPHLGLRLPQKARIEFEDRKLINQQPELGHDWFAFDMFRNETDTVRWIGWASGYTK